MSAAVTRSTFSGPLFTNMLSNSVAECMRLYLRDLRRLPNVPSGGSRNRVSLNMKMYRSNACYRFGFLAGIAELAAKYGGGELEGGHVVEKPGSEVFEVDRVYGFRRQTDAGKFRDAVRKRNRNDKVEISVATS